MSLLVLFYAFVLLFFLQFGQIECVKWLVKNTCIREKLGGRDGERSLLHAAAKYGKVRNY